MLSSRTLLVREASLFGNEVSLPATVEAIGKQSNLLSSNPQNVKLNWTVQLLGPQSVNLSRFFETGGNLTNKR